MTTTTFNLVDEPWIQVRRVDGSSGELSLLDALVGAHEIERLAGEIPTQDAAVLRLMLAILYRCPLPESTERFADAAARSVWQQLWELGELPRDEITEYLGRYRHRFDLLDPAQPLFQAPDLATKRGSTSGLVSLVAEVQGPQPLFSQRRLGPGSTLSLAEAARWVIHCQSYDPSGIKSGAIGDDRVKGGKGYPIGVGWTGGLGLIVLEGNNLAQTLLLNFVPGLRTPNDRPVWERPPLGSGPEADHVAALGPADLFTWPVRRLRLVVDDDRVCDVLVTNGDRIERENQHALEPMTEWRLGKAAKGAPKPVYPRRYFDDRAVWRGFEATLAEGAPESSAPGLGSREWLAELVNYGVLDPAITVGYRAIGLIYGSNDSVIDGAIDDRVDVAVGALTDPDLRHEIGRAVVATSKAVSLVGYLASDLAVAAGCPEHEVASWRTPAREAAYARLDPEFRDWVRSLKPGEAVERARSRWQRAALGVLRRLGGEMVVAAGPEAALGFVDEERGLLDAGRAELKFQRGLRKNLPDAFGEGGEC